MRTIPALELWFFDNCCFLLCHIICILAGRNRHAGHCRTWLHQHCTTGRNTNQQATQSIGRQCAVFVMSWLPHHDKRHCAPPHIPCPLHNHGRGVAHNLQATHPSILQKQTYASPSNCGSPIINELSRVACSSNLRMVSSGFLEIPAPTIDSSCDTTGLLPFAVIQ